jgi:hypothetical protein
VNAVVFTGPTLSAAEARRELAATYLPPAAEGDVYRAARKGPQVIGIIDGHFERQPAVWHKEVLWAMSRGIHVFGAASMGALRAAELEAFGMEGVGSIFDAYLTGALEDDDEVAVAQAPAELGFRALSDAMVDIRHTLERAVDARVLTTATGKALESIAKAMFYPDRRYARVLQSGREAGLPAAELDSFQAWLPAGCASLKREDALAMLRTIGDRLAAGLSTKAVRYSFENSSMWESAWRLAGESDDSDVIVLDSVLDELRLEGEAYLRVQQAAMARVLAIKHSYVQGLAQGGPQRVLAERRLWSRQNITNADDRRRWMDANHIDDVRMQGLLEDEARVGWITSLAALDAKGYVLDQLRVSGDYPRLVERLRAKQAALAADGMEAPTLSAAGLTVEELHRWYFEERLGRAVPADLDAYLANVGYAGLAAFHASVLREFCFVKGSPVKARTQG